MPDPERDRYEPRADWAEWVGGLPTRRTFSSLRMEPVFPDPHEDGGLPDGWRIESRYAMFGMDNHDAVLVQCPDGMWLRVVHRRNMSLSSPTGQYATLVDMHAVAVRRAVADESPDGLDGLFPEAVARWTGRVLMRSYDLTVPAEAAEQMMLALGGPVSLNPSIFSRPSDPS